jgi:hypothetical protein
MMLRNKLIRLRQVKGHYTQLLLAFPSHRLPLHRNLGALSGDDSNVNSDSVGV